MHSLTIIAFAINLIAALLNTVVGIRGKSTFNVGCAFVNWALAGFFLGGLVN